MSQSLPRTPAPTVASVNAVLLRATNHAQDPDMVLFATILAKSLDLRSLGHLGLAPEELDAMVLHYFPELGPQATSATDVAFAREQWRIQRAVFQQTGLSDVHGDFIRLIRNLLNAHCVPGLPASAWVISTLAHACLRPDHLWRDLGLTGREAVTALLNRHVPSLVTLNVHNLRWKQFLSYTAHEHAGLSPSPAPGCPGCEDYDYCYAKR